MKVMVLIAIFAAFGLNLMSLDVRAVEISQAQQAEGTMIADAR